MLSVRSRRASFAILTSRLFINKKHTWDECDISAFPLLVLRKLIIQRLLPMSNFPGQSESCRRGNLLITPCERSVQALLSATT